MVIEKEESAPEAIVGVAIILAALHVGAISAMGLKHAWECFYFAFTRYLLMVKDKAKKTLLRPLCLWQTVTKAFLLFNPNNGVSTQAWSAVYCGRLVPQGDEAKTMKLSLNYKALLLILLVLVYSSKLSARFLLSKQGQEEVNLDEITSEGTEDSELMNQLTGLELCDGGDEECLTRRIIAEAHLDYIYTQHHKP
ncbi:hypothetical protein POTOM_035023 [Populus tomentosa]|uniref:Phytosulfokine n=1 Tax=Populus tomentosa TaxID=118781 RepID=A0A8X7Z2A4_POPTO|nr:hypothetical protein POTOM_035023 [Populus tomentosa]